MRSLSLLCAVAIASVSAFAAGCGSSDAPAATADPSEAEFDNWGAKDDGETRPLGTFIDNSDDYSFPLITDLVLKSDRTFRRMVMPEKYAKLVEETGTYTLTKSSKGNRYLRFYGADKAQTDWWSYKLEKGWLELRTSGRNARLYASGMHDAWCKEAADCEMQGLPKPDCTVARSCAEDSTCSTICSAGGADSAWIEAVKAAYDEKFMALDNEVAREDLPATAQREFDELTNIRGDYYARAFKMTVDGKTAWAVEETHDGGMSAYFYADTGEVIAYGSNDERTAFQWE
jgi:hypothetical protein